MSHFRHLPPATAPLNRSDLSYALSHSGDALQHFRDDLAEFLDIPQESCVLASSGRTALYILLNGLKQIHGERSQIIMPAYTCPAVARVAIDLNLDPVYVDLSPMTMAYELQQLEAALSEKTLAVVIVHPFGIPLEVGETLNLSRKAGAVVIEDAAQSFGARWQGKPVGLQADYGLFSLGPGKPISTGGGGFVIANSSDGIGTLTLGQRAVSKAGSLSSMQAWVRQGAFQLAFHPRGWWLATRIGLHRVGNHEASWGYNLTELTPSQAAVGTRLLPRLAEINSARRQKAEKLKDCLAQSIGCHSITVPPEGEPIYLRFPIIAQNEEQRESLFKQFWSQGIGVGRLYEKTMPDIFGLKNGKSFPGAEVIASRLLTLPTHHYVTEDDLQTMYRIFQNIT